MDFKNLSQPERNLGETEDADMIYCIVNNEFFQGMFGSLTDFQKFSLYRQEKLEAYDHVTAVCVQYSAKEESLPQRYVDRVNYMQTLRDMPQQPGFDPANPSWPEEPTS